jgi:hypothetical protein
VERAAEYGDFGGSLDSRARRRPSLICRSALERLVAALEALRPASCEVSSWLPPLMVCLWVEFLRFPER